MSGTDCQVEKMDLLQDKCSSGELHHHPLQNSLILELTFNYCSVPDLKIFRQVCPLWRDSSQKAWRSTALLRITSHSKPDSCPVSEYLALSTSLYKTAPFTHNFKVDSDHPQFWESVGPHVKMLELDNVTFESVESFRNVVYKSCPNLEDLRLRCVTLAGPGHRVVEPQEWTEMKVKENKNLKSLMVFADQDWTPVVSWMELLSVFPSLVDLSFAGEVEREYFDGLFKAVKLVREQHPEKLKIKRIDVANANILSRRSQQNVRMRLQPIPYRPLLQVLLESDLHLTSLSLKGNDLSSSAGDRSYRLKKIFKSHGSTLQKLSLRDYKKLEPHCCFPSIEEKKLEALSELVLHSKVFRSMTFLNFTAHLKKLVLVNNFPKLLRLTKFGDMSFVKLNFCTELEIHGQTDKLAIADLNKLIDWLPNVERLTMSALNNGQFAVACERWPNLVSLRITDSLVDDAGITGLDPEDAEKISGEGEEGTWRPITVPRANITGLKNLLTFEVYTGIQLGFCAFLYGFKQLTHLHQLHIKEPQASVEEGGAEGKMREVNKKTRAWHVNFKDGFKDLNESNSNSESESDSEEEFNTVFGSI